MPEKDFSDSRQLEYTAYSSNLFGIIFFHYVERIFVYQKSLIPTFQTNFFYYKITFLNSQLENTNSKSDFVFCV